MSLLKPILFAYLRHALTAAAGYLLAHGLIDQAGGQVLASAGLALAGLAWTTLQKLAVYYALQNSTLNPGAGQQLAAQTHAR